MNETEAKLVINNPYVICQKHGKVENFIRSAIPGHEGHWCQICWLEMLGPPLELHGEEE